MKVYGSWAGENQNIYVDCDKQTLAVEAAGHDNISFVDVRLTAEQLSKPRPVPIIPITTTPCPSAGPSPGSTGVTVTETDPTIKGSASLGEMLVGVDMSAASSTNPAANLLALGVFDIPVKQTGDVPMSRTGVWLSGQLGLKGMAQPGSVSGASSSGYYASAANATPDKIVQSVDASLHLAVQLGTGWHIPVETFASDTPAAASGGSSNPHPAQKPKKIGTWATLSLIAGAGIVTPLSASQSSLQVYEATSSVLAAYKSIPPSCSPAPSSFISTSCFAVFVPDDRTHFYRAYDAGFRLKLYGADYTHGDLRFPAILDLTVGQNEYVTGGQLHGPVLHLGGSFPFPRVDSVYVFGSMDLGLLKSNGDGAQLLLVPAAVTAGVSVTSPTVYEISTSQPNRDRYELGFGVDIYHLFSSHSDKNKNK